MLDAMIISEVTAVVDADTFERPIYAGNAIQTVKSGDAKKVMTIRTANFDAAGEGGSASVEDVTSAGNSGLSEWVEDKVADSDRPELTSAGVVVSGGRGVGSEDDFNLIEGLLTNSTQLLAPRALRSIPAMRRTTGRLVRQVRWLLRISTSLWVSRAQFSTSPV